MYTGFNGSFIHDSQMYESFPEQSIYPSTMDYGMYQNNKMQHEDVRIEQGNGLDNALSGGLYGGNWMGDMEQSSQKYCASSTQQTQYSGLAASFPQPLLSLGSNYDFEYAPAVFSSYADSTVYSNESSPCLNSYDMDLSAPHSPITPPTPPNQMYSAPSNFYTMPVMTRDATGAMRSMYMAKQGSAEYYSTQQYPLQHNGAGYVQPSTYGMGYGYTEEPQNVEFGYAEAQQEEEVDDGPELVGMGLYDDLPELAHSNMSSPELACQQSPPMLGRGLVLEQSFGLPEDHEDDEEEEEDEEDDEDCDSVYNEGMQY